jgi:hypothetical protein
MARKGSTISSTRGNNMPMLLSNKMKPPASHNIGLECSPSVGTQNNFLVLSTNVTRILSRSNSENNPIWNKE